VLCMHMMFVGLNAKKLAFILTFLQFFSLSFKITLYFFILYYFSMPSDVKLKEGIEEIFLSSKNQLTKKDNFHIRYILNFR